MSRSKAPILVTGAAGFIGFHVVQRLLDRGDEVVGLDNLNEYYDVRLKRARLEQLTVRDRFRFIKLDLANRNGMRDLFAEQPISRVVHLAAQAGVRYSLVNPHAYTESNIEGFMNILEGCRHGKVEHLVYASSSSVYGGNTHMPFSIHDNVDHPVSLYAASKKANELMAHCYAHLYKLPCTGLRFFTVYGPWGRPDMALFIFTKSILEGKPIEVFNHGKMKRDFTYVDDIVEGVIRTLDHTAAANPSWSGERRAGARLQHRQSPAGGAAALYRGFGAGDRKKGGEKAPAAAARRRAGDLCRHRRPLARRGFQARHADRGGNPAFRAVVSRVLQSVRKGSAPFYGQPTGTNPVPNSRDSAM
jgi:UDP-glucuronate 4-epimerase